MSKTPKQFNSILEALARHKPIKSKPIPKNDKKTLYSLKRQK